MRRERPSRRVIAAATGTGRSLTIGRVSQATSHAASGCVPANSAFGAELFPPAAEWPEREVDPLFSSGIRPPHGRARG